MMQHQPTLVSSNETTLYKCEKCQTEFMSFSKDKKQKCISCGDKGAMNMEVKLLEEKIEGVTGKKASSSKASFEWCKGLLHEAMHYAILSDSVRLESFESQTPKGDAVRVQIVAEANSSEDVANKNIACVNISVTTKSSAAISNLILFATTKRKEFSEATGLQGRISINSTGCNVTFVIYVDGIDDLIRACCIRWVVFG